MLAKQRWNAIISLNASDTMLENTNMAINNNMIYSVC